MEHTVTKVHNRGFTLIELLVVISIIALLAAIVLASLQKARQGAQDAAKVEEIHELQVALESYYNDYGTYPLESEGDYLSDLSVNQYGFLLSPAFSGSKYMNTSVFYNNTGADATYGTKGGLYAENYHTGYGSGSYGGEKFANGYFIFFEPQTAQYQKNVSCTTADYAIANLTYGNPAGGVYCVGYNDDSSDVLWN